MDRRTDRPDGSGGASPTAVTARADGTGLVGTGLIGDDRDIVAPPRQQPRLSAASAPAASAPPDDSASDGTPGSGHPATGAPASGNGIGGTRGASANRGKDARPGAGPADAVADGVPALPADTIGTPRGARPKRTEVPATETAEAGAGDQAPDDDPPTYVFEAIPSDSADITADVPAALGSPGAAPGASGAGWAAGPGELAVAVKPAGDDPSPAAPSGTVPSGTVPSGRPSPAGPSAAPEPPSVSPAAFAWEMPDPPPSSPSSPARTFLRSGAGAQSAAPKAAASPAGTRAPSPAAAGVTVQKGKSKRNARQAHLTIARVEPSSVMKFSFVVSLVAFVVLFVAVSVLYAVLNGLGVFDSLQHVVSSVTSSQNSAGVNARAWFSASKVLGYTALLGSFNIVLITAMSTIGSVVYNLTSRLVGGVEVTLRETE